MHEIERKRKEIEMKKMEVAIMDKEMQIYERQADIKRLEDRRESGQARRITN